ncbi:MAG: hypothetical protein ACLTXL_07505 [Clostridia bacterium]
MSGHDLGLYMDWRYRPDRRDEAATMGLTSIWFTFGALVAWIIAIMRRPTMAAMAVFRRSVWIDAGLHKAFGG